MENKLGNSLLLTCLFSVIRKRQFMILRQLEHHDRLSGNQLAAMISSSRRTIITDMEDLRQFFAKSAEISADSNVYELKIKDLAAYQKRKEAI